MPVFVTAVQFSIITAYFYTGSWVQGWHVASGKPPPAVFFERSLGALR